MIETECKCSCTQIACRVSLEYVTEHSRRCDEPQGPIISPANGRLATLVSGSDRTLVNGRPRHWPQHHSPLPLPPRPRCQRELPPRGRGIEQLERGEQIVLDVELVGASSRPAARVAAKTSRARARDERPAIAAGQPTPEHFWEGTAPEGNLFGVVEPPPRSAPILRRLGPFPFWREARGGIKARSFGKQWWSRRWVAVLEALNLRVCGIN